MVSCFTFTNRKLNNLSLKMISTTNEKVYIAIGSNEGDKYTAIKSAVNELRKISTIESTSFLYESAPMYHEDQATFLNTACVVTTELEPQQLLSELKDIEHRIGRVSTFRNGPRVLDLDIIFYGSRCHSSDTLQIPHPKLHERPFVLKPLCDLHPELHHPQLDLTVTQLLDQLPAADRDALKKVLPVSLGENNTSFLNWGGKEKMMLMGVINATPDSFSDGGLHECAAAAVARATLLVQEGVTVLDVGGESTRPGAATVSPEEEIDRVVPVIRGIREAGIPCLISIDTRKASVAEAAINAGANIINDVSAGRYDPEMLPFVGRSGLPFIAMHMRGDPENMLTQTHYVIEGTKNDLTSIVAAELEEQMRRIDLFVPRWLQVVDPGVGFAKNKEQNMELLKPSNMRRFKKLLGSRPLLIGLSRKKFLSTLLSKSKEERGLQNDKKEVSIEERDLATAGACCAAVLGGADILRVHSAAEVRMVCDVFLSILSDDIESFS